MPHPPTAPGLAAAAACLAALRVQLDRLDVDIADGEPATGDRLMPRLLALRENVDQLEADLEADAAGLAKHSRTGPTGDA